MVRPVNPWGRNIPNLKGIRLSTVQKTYIAYVVNDRGVSPTLLSKQLGISKSVIQKYAQVTLKGGVLQNTAGRPGVFDSPAKEIIKQKLGGEKGIQVNTGEAKKLYKEQLSSTAERRNLAPCQQKSPDPRTIKEFEKKHNIKDYVSEETSDAREEACGNIRNTVATIVQFHSASKLCSHPAQHLNFDATQYSVGDKATKGAKKSKAKIIGKPQKGKSMKTRKEKGKKGLVSYFVKQYVAIQPTGGSAPLVYCLADSNMKEGEIDVHDVAAGLLGLNDNDKSYVVFAKDRSMNTEFYKWYWRSVILPHSIEVRKKYGLEGKLLCTNCDGEDQQIDCFSDDAFFQEVKQANVMTDKPSASTTEITQACDQDIFKEGKKENSKITDEDVDTDGLPFKTVSAIVALHQNRVKKVMSPSHVRMACYGICRVQISSQNAYTVPRNKKCFKRIGQWPYNEKVILSHCTKKLSAVQEKAIFAGIPQLTVLYDKWGTLTTEDFNAAGIPNNDKENSKPKEDGATCLMRSVRLTHSHQHDGMAEKAPAKAVRKEKRKQSKTNKEQGLKDGSRVAMPYKPKKAKK